MRFLALDKLINLQEGYRQRFKIDALDLILVREAGEISALRRCVLIKSSRWSMAKSNRE